ncbi:hypothetical protein [Pseudoalteromonas xiamenensis]|uniref:Uncharacterized protein n=1 Tax=Pseudoalteromonas xiamenensis TaxID=882626 RepID=A0A975DEZ4_9GAMM|nr:hypothetical protein [Pseudoalteromonas xiamenensis]QTH70588.1 hypothetical protein J5O05_11580 [Pseudoalteromonas xiamenensis]
MKFDEFINGISVRPPEPQGVELHRLKGRETSELIEKFNAALSGNDAAELSAISKILFSRFQLNLKRTSNVGESINEIGNMLSIIYHKLH